MMDCRKLFVFILCGISLSIADVNDPTLVTLPGGQIKGKTQHSANGKVYYAFQEIPYAAAPTGKLRFQPPREPPKWDGMLSTTKNTKICCKTDRAVISDTRETEDCLYLNVFTPVRPGDSSKPPLGVLIWIHGGGFSFGSGVAEIFKPQYFMDYSVIIVTLNYRLGALGFLTTEDEVIPGNLGLKDQQFCIKWVKENIHLFGGDPEKITISGRSAGAVSVGFQLISPKNKGLFRGAILQSGTPLNQWARQDHARFYAFELGRSLDPNFKSNDSKELLKLLQRMPVSKIINNTVSPSIGKENTLIESSGLIWLPIIEKTNIEGALVTGPFHEDVRKGNINKVSTLLGFNSEEELLFWKPVTDANQLLEARAKYLDNDLSNFIRNKFNMIKENKLIAGVIIHLRQLSSDTQSYSLATPMYICTNYHIKEKWEGLKDFEVAGVRGVGHGEELGYLFDSPVSSDGTADDPEDLVMRQRLLTLWANFIKFLNPTPERGSLLNNITWEKVTPNSLVYRTSTKHSKCREIQNTIPNGKKL